MDKEGQLTNDDRAALRIAEAAIDEEYAGEADGEAHDFSLARALLNAQIAISGVAHNARNQYSNYNYTSAEQIISAARQALHQNGLALTRTYKLIRYEDPTYIADVESTFVLSCPDSGEEAEAVTAFPVVLGKGKPHDKAVATALTSGLAYYLRDLLLLPRPNSDDEMDTRNDESFAPPGSRPRAKPVVQVVREMEGAQDSDKVAKATVRMCEFLDAGDAKGLNEFSSALDIGLQLAVWTGLDSKERRKIKELIASVREHQDPRSIP